MKKIYLLPVGKVKVEPLKKLLLQLEERFFYKFEVLNPVPIPRDSYDSFKKQYEAGIIINGISRYKPEDTKILTGISDVDIFTDKLNFVFGHNSFADKIAVISTYRLNPEYYGGKKDDNLLYDRTLKELIHELGHLLGIKHCYDKTCVMYSTSNVFDVDNKSTFLCDECQKKLKKETKNV